ncbi:hypothetical protein NZD89_26420 [Alicyclobacillus fastidiosus]|uniref:Uncharacterized protein n=1 Tax=Alicyclobacillus fastidiosus TaxID=392011 RepID=A0ABY6ZGI9_9BACL|nr:hypothetical protein [Alicyclobacillus fastidiosus]WAH41703.1 hypothetical protein NZD89_26420 [Alicyclobacillus fastidiosus]
MDVIDAISRLTGMKARMILFQDVLHENLISSRRGLMVSQEDTLTDYTAAIGLAMRGV